MILRSSLHHKWCRRTCFRMKNTLLQPLPVDSDLVVIWRFFFWNGSLKAWRKKIVHEDPALIYLQRVYPHCLSVSDRPKWRTPARDKPTTWAPIAPTNLQHYPTLPPSYILKHKNLKSRQLFKKVGCFVFFRAFHPVPWPLKGTVVPTPTPIIPKRGAGSLTVDLLQFVQKKILPTKKRHAGVPG